MMFTRELVAHIMATFDFLRYFLAIALLLSPHYPLMIVEFSNVLHSGRAIL